MMIKSRASQKIFAALALFIIPSVAYPIADAPLFLSTASVPNVLFNMSVEKPMGGVAYNDGPDSEGCTDRVQYPGETTPGVPSTFQNQLTGQVGVCYFPTREYLGYFDPRKCYNYTTDPDDSYFSPTGPTNALHECAGQYSGNFMNWATMTAMDEFVYAATAGNRSVDIPSKTVIRRARKVNDATWYPLKRISTQAIPYSRGPAGYGVNVAPSTVTPYNVAELFIYNTEFNVRFGTKPWAAVIDDEDERNREFVDGFRTAADHSGNEGVFLDEQQVRVEVCVSGMLEENCVLQANGSYKPYGLIQENMDKMRFGVMSYSGSGGWAQHGGVLRANMKYVGPFMPDGSGGRAPNPYAEVDATTGALNINPNPDDAVAGKSGVIPYLNKFNQDRGYMDLDPASELFYESTRYFRNLGPTPLYYTGANNGGFPIITNWEDPIQNECQKNFMIGINDAFPWLDKRVAGTHFTSPTFGGRAFPKSSSRGYAPDYGEPITDPVLSNAATSTTFWTNEVGRLQGINGTARRVACTATNCDYNANDKIIPGLGEVVGVASSGVDKVDRENTYYISGLAYYLNTQDIRPDFDGEQNVTTFMIDSQEYKFGSPATTGEMNLLWLAGKYGGFTDENGDNEPQLDEWDANGDGEPDNYVLANKPAKMVEGLRRAFDIVANSSASVSSVSSNSTRVTNDAFIYQATFNSDDWASSFKAFQFNPDGTVESEPEWYAEEQFPAASARDIFSYNTATSAPISFAWADLSAAQRAMLGSEDVTNHIRGDRTLEGSDPTDLRERTHLLGAIINSSPWYVGDDENFGYGALPGTEGDTYNAFVSDKGARSEMVYVAANDGMLHGFDSNSGVERFAYIPASVIPKLARTSLSDYGCAQASCEKFEYIHDGSPIAGDAYLDGSWRTILVNTLGAGGSGVYALDITSPDSFSKNDVLWEVSSATPDFSGLGKLIPRASAVRLKTGQWVAIVANGYESVTQEAVLYIIDLETGERLKEFNTGEGSAANPNGLSQPFVVDSNRDGIADLVYAGDLHGNMWKFDISGPTVGSWNIAFGGSPLFAAEDPDGAPQHITSSPVVGLHPEGGLMVYFGTGKYYDDNDQIVSPLSQVNSFYGIRDLGTRIAIGRLALQEQTIEAEVSLTVPELEFRVTSDEAVNYPAKSGWYIDLLSPHGVEGERVVFLPQLRQNRVVFVTLIPDSDPCSAGGVSWFMELDPISGGRLVEDPLGGDGVFGDDDYRRIFDPDGDGEFAPYNSVGGRRIDHIVPPGAILGGGNVDGRGVEHTIFPNPDGPDGSDGNVYDSEVDPNSTGRQSWQQLQ